MRIVVIDDHPLVRKGLISVLCCSDEIAVSGEASNVNQGVDLIVNTTPDLALVDLRLGSECGLDIVKKIKKDNFDCKFIIITSFGNEEDFKQAEEIGIDGYLLKEALPDEILYAINLVKNGRKYYDPNILDIIIRPQAKNSPDALTPREIEVLIALGKGYNNSDIAKSLFITEYTVKKHISHILSKLNLSDRTQAAIYAHNNGLVKFN